MKHTDVRLESLLQFIRWLRQPMVTGKVQSVLRDSMEIETGVMIALS